MTAENFKITSKTLYTIHSEHGEVPCEGITGLKEHVDNALGGFVDLMSHNRASNNVIRQCMADHEFLVKYRQDLETIFAMQDEVARIEASLKPEPDCSEYYCHRCGSSSGIEYVG